MMHGCIHPHLLHKVWLPWPVQWAVTNLHAIVNHFGLTPRPVYVGCAKLVCMQTWTIIVFCVHLKRVLNTYFCCVVFGHFSRMFSANACFLCFGIYCCACTGVQSWSDLFSITTSCSRSRKLFTFCVNLKSLTCAITQIWPCQLNHQLKTIPKQCNSTTLTSV